MKKKLCLVFLLAFVSCFCLTIHADESTHRTSMFYDGTQTDLNGKSIGEIVDDTFDLEWVTKQFQQDRHCSDFENIRIDTDAFIVGYKVESESFFELLSEEQTLSFDHNTYKNCGVLADPMIYVPVVGDTNGNERIFGCVYIKRDYIEGGYSYNRSIGHITEDFLNGGKCSVSFLEDFSTLDKVNAICEQYGIYNIENALLIQNMYAVSKYAEMAVYIESADGIYVYDYQNTLGAESEASQIYTLEEYSVLRLEYEKSEMQHRNFGGKVSNNIAENLFVKNKVLIVCVAVAAVIIIAVSVCLVVYKKKKHAKSK